MPTPLADQQRWSPSRARAVGLLAGMVADAVLGDPQRWHPVAGFGRAASALEQRSYRDSRARGAVFASAAVGGAVALGWAIERSTAGRPWARAVATAGATWLVLGGRGLADAGERVGSALVNGDIAGARASLPWLCARDPANLGPAELARATVESLAENTSDAVVAPLVWGAVSGVPGLLGYRAVNTLDAMVGYRSARYRQFGWAAARLDDLANLAPARLTGLLTVACAPLVGGSPRRAWRVLIRDGARHPSPNAGHPEAAAAGALGVQLGGRNAYQGTVERRPTIGEGPRPDAITVHRAVRLTRVVGWAGAIAAVGATAGAAMGVRMRIRHKPSQNVAMLARTRIMGLPFVPLGVPPQASDQHAAQPAPGRLPEGVEPGRA